MKFILVLLVSAVIAAFIQAAAPIINNAMHVSVTLDDSPFIAAGTPFQRPKIANSIVDVIGGTPMVFIFVLICAKTFVCVLISRCTRCTNQQPRFVSTAWQQA
jgi:hypothetical protein